MEETQLIIEEQLCYEDDTVNCKVYDQDYCFEIFINDSYTASIQIDEHGQWVQTAGEPVSEDMICEISCKIQHHFD